MPKRRFVQPAEQNYRRIRESPEEKGDSAILVEASFVQPVEQFSSIFRRIRRVSLRSVS
jgi:hypothetical protein